MKKLLCVVVAVVAVMNIACAVFAAEDVVGGKVVAYYFRGRARCHACIQLEKNSREAIEAYFKDAIDAGKLEFKVVNIDERGNEHFVTRYQLYTRSLVLSLMKGGEEVQSKNLTKIWQYARNKQQFNEYVITEVSGFLMEAY